MNQSLSFIMWSPLSCDWVGVIRPLIIIIIIIIIIIPNHSVSGSHYRRDLFHELLKLIPTHVPHWGRRCDDWAGPKFFSSPKFFSFCANWIRLKC